MYLRVASWVLFIFYANDLSSYVSNSKVFVYADDTKICHEISLHNPVPDISDLQSDIDNIETWSLISLLALHPDKTYTISFCSPKVNSCPHTYLLNNEPITAKSSCKDLGVRVSSDLSWSLHIHKVLQKAYGTLQLIKRTFLPESTPVLVKKYLYLSLVLPILTYASPIWRPQHQKDIIAIELRCYKNVLPSTSSTTLKLITNPD